MRRTRVVGYSPVSFEEQLIINLYQRSQPKFAAFWFFVKFSIASSKTFLKKEKKPYIAINYNTLGTYYFLKFICILFHEWNNMLT